MSQENNEVLSAVILMERVIPRLHENSRETIKRSQLMQISQSLNMVLKQLVNNCKEPLILTPIMEVITLIDNVTDEPTFVETDAETKKLIVERLNNAINRLYLFAGKFYMENEFTWNMTKGDVLRHIVDYCLSAGFYFGYDKELKSIGLI